MTPQEKAQDLFTRFKIKTSWFCTTPENPNNLVKDGLPNSQVKEVCLLVVDEILDGFRKILPSSRSYWEDVKEEIKKL